MAENPNQNRARTDIRVMKPDVRGDRRKDVADITRDVVQGKADLPDIMAGLHRTLKELNNANHLERQVLTTVLEANFILAKAVEAQGKLITDVTARVEYLEGQLKDLREGKFSFLAA